VALDHLDFLGRFEQGGDGPLKLALNQRDGGALLVVPAAQLTLNVSQVGEVGAVSDEPAGFGPPSRLVKHFLLRCRLPHPAGSDLVPATNQLCLGLGQLFAAPGDGARCRLPRLNPNFEHRL